MGPLLAELSAQLFLLGGQNFPVVPGIRLLHQPDKRRGLAGADVHAPLDDFSQASAKVVAPVAQIERRVHVDHVTLPQLGNLAGLAPRLDLAESSFARASGFGGSESAAGFDASS